MYNNTFEYNGNDNLITGTSFDSTTIGNLIKTINSATTAKQLYNEIFILNINPIAKETYSELKFDYQLYVESINNGNDIPFHVDFRYIPAQEYLGYMNNFETFIKSQPIKERQK